MSLVDASQFGADWTATALNADGTVVGLYNTSKDRSHLFSSVGSYLWNGDAATDAIDLPGLIAGSGVTAFAVGPFSTVYGTSLGADGSLHMARLSDGEGPVDLGSLSMFVGDLSFRPSSLTFTSVTNSLIGPGGSYYNYEVAGFAVDASGVTRSMLWKDDNIHSVIDLLPTYLSFSAISNAYGSKVLINDGKQIACAGTDSDGQ